MDYSKFYTPPQIANLLVRKVNVPHPDTAIDICCGSCNLLRAAKKRWKNTTLFGVDIKPHIASDLNFMEMDGRQYAIKHAKKYPLVLANPPFDFVKTNREFPLLYQGVFSSYSTKRLENEMLLANLLLLQENGTLVIILPSTFVEAESNTAIRSLIGKNYYVREIIKLPEDTFGASNINSYALIIKNSSPKKKTTNSSCVIFENEQFLFENKCTVPQKDIQAGRWYDRYSATNEAFDIRRGNVSSQMFCDKGTAILHTAKKSEQWKPSLRYCAVSGENLVYAESGDIIISRIGKSAGQWGIYRGEKILISDCLYRIKDPTGKILNRLQGHEYDFPQKGVATRYITINDFKSWYCSLSSDVNAEKSTSGE